MGPFTHRPLLSRDIGRPGIWAAPPFHLAHFPPMHLETNVPLPCRGLGGAQAADPLVGWGAGPGPVLEGDRGPQISGSGESRGCWDSGGAPGSLCATWGLGAVAGLAKFKEPEMASPKLCWGSPTKPAACRRPESPLPSVHPAFQAPGQARGRGDVGASCQIQTRKKMLTFQRSSVRWTHVRTDPEAVVRVLTEPRARGGWGRWKETPTRCGNEGKGWGRKEREQPEERRVRQPARAGGRGRAQTERGRGWREPGELQARGGGCWQGKFGRVCQKGLEPKPCEAVDRGGSNHQPWAGDGLAERERRKGDGQASFWGPCQ